VTSLVLASASPARLTTLRAAGIEPTVRVSDVDEDAILDRLGAAGHLDPRAAVLELAHAKAQAVAGLISDDPAAFRPGLTVVLGCDSMLEFDGEILGKPHRPEVAVERWQAMRGRSGVLHTGHWAQLLGAEPGSGAEAGDVSSTVVHFADLSDQEIEDYVATGEPLKVAGAFTVDGLGGAFVRGVEGDHHGVIGLSLPLVRTLLAGLGIRWTSLWNR